MNKELNEEQLNQPEANVTAVTDDGAMEGVSSSYGKFKDAQGLLEAYNNLQAEFTRKCQKLSEFEKLRVPIYQKENWQGELASFLNTNTAAKKFSREIAEVIMGDPSIACEDKALDIAFAKVMAEKYVSPESLVSSDEFIKNHLLSNEELKSKILLDMVKDLKNLPTLISGETSMRVAGTADRPPMSLADAKQMALEMLHKNNN